MTNETSQRGIEDQLWPIVCATAVLVGVLVVVVSVNSDFDDDRLLFNGYTQLFAVAGLGAFIIFLGSLIKGRARRTAELAILFSLALHAAGGLGACYLFELPTVGFGHRTATLEVALEGEDDAQTPADFHWGQSDDDQSAQQQAFEKPVETVVRDEKTPAAELKPRNLERPVPVAEVPRKNKADVTPLGVGSPSGPSKPLDIRRPEAAKTQDLPPAEALAMVRRKAEDLAIPDSEPAPVAMPEISKEPAKAIEPRGVQAEKSDKYLWATVAKKMADPNNVPVPPPRGKPPAHIDAAESMPAPQIVAQLPSRASARISTQQSGAQAADEISQAGSSLDRTDRGTPLPSTIVPDAGMPPQLAAAAGSSPGSRLDKTSSVAVEASDSSQAPLGPNVASAGSQDFGRGSSPLPTRRGAIIGHGRAEPTLEGDIAENPDELRAGSPGSSLQHGLALAAAPARRAVASQTEGGGSGLSAGQGGALPRTQSEMGLLLPAASRIDDGSNFPGTGGVGKKPGGMTSNLDVGQNIAVRRVAGSGTVRGNSRDAVNGSGVDDLPLSGYTVGSGKGTAPGLAATGPRRVENGTGDGVEDGVGSIPRRRGQSFDPHATIDPVGPIAGDESISRGPNQGTGPIGRNGKGAGPEASVGGTGRLYGSDRKIGARPAGTADSDEIASAVGVAAPQHMSAVGRGHRGAGDLDEVLSGDGTGGVGRGRGSVDVNSSVHEPLDAFRHGPVRGGQALGDSGDGQLTEPAIESGLEYFARTQFPDGHWSLHEAPPGVALDPASLGELHADTAATGLALLSYMAAGYTHQDEKYRESVRRGIDWLVKHQAADGNLSYRGSDPTQFYSHGIAAMALCEAYGMTQDRDLREAAQKAVNFIVRSQDPSRGGWRYRPREGSDTSVSGWQLMALRSAQMAGLDVPDETLQKVGHWLDLAQVPNRGTYVYNPWNLDTEDERKGRAPSPTMTAQAMVMRMYLGQDHDEKVLRQGADYVKQHLPDTDADDSTRDCYYWYYATQAMYHMQGDYWKAWDKRITPLLRAGQIEKGPLKGSWSGLDPSPDRSGAKAGRHYVTAMHVLTLEFRYWHLPLFRELRRD